MSDPRPRPVFPSLAAAWEDWSRTAGEGGEPLSEEVRATLKPVFMHGATCLFSMFLTLPLSRAEREPVIARITQELEAFCAESEGRLLEQGARMRH